MKKLYINIEEIKIKGRPHLLTQPVSDIDERMQAIAQATECIKGIMFKFSGTNQGIQYQKACNAVCELSKELYGASETLNDVQCQIVKFENKCHNYEEESELAVKPRRHSVKVVKVSSNTSEIEFHKAEMITVKNALENYTRGVREQCKILRANRDSIGRIWTDRQFKDFSTYIDDVCAVVETGCKQLDEYKIHLNNKIKNLA